ncbi:c-type cytochrome, partial [Streptomyces niveiscabiei]
GKDIFEGVCNRCHQGNGNAPLYGESGDVSSLGWVSRQSPAQAVHKIRNGVPSAEMLSLRFLDIERVGDLLAYLQTLEVK